MMSEMFIYALLISPLYSVNLDYYSDDYQYLDVVNPKFLDFEDDEDMVPNFIVPDLEPTPSHILPPVTGDFKTLFIPLVNYVFQMFFFLHQNNLKTSSLPRSSLPPPWEK